MEVQITPYRDKPKKEGWGKCIREEKEENHAAETSFD